jgi:tRNA U38,U39,U40 pseudouridine synthase TruA
MATAEMAVMGLAGDTKLLWDADNEDEVENARRTFKDLVGKKKYAAFSVKKGGEQGAQIREFDPDAEKIILVPPMQGG